MLRYCNDHGIAVQPQGGLTGLAGGAVPVGPCVIAALERMRAIKEIDTAAGTITVEAGVAMEAVQKAADAADLFFPLDLGGRGSCQIGGNVSTNAGGNRVLRYGMARDLVLGVEAVLADGTVIDALRKVIKNNSGYDLRQLFIGAEGTLGIVTAVVLRLFPKPRSTCTGICAVNDYAGRARAAQARAQRLRRAARRPIEVMWPDFYQLGTVALGRKPPLELGHGVYVLIETLGTDPEGDQARYETRDRRGHRGRRGARTPSSRSRSARPPNCGPCAIHPANGRRACTGRSWASMSACPPARSVRWPRRSAPS